MEKPKFIPEVVAKKGSELLSYPGRIKRWVQRDPFSTGSWVLLLASIENVAHAYVQASINNRLDGKDFAIAAPSALGAFISAANMDKGRNRFEKAVIFTEGVVSQAGAALVQTGNPDLFYPGLLVGTVGWGVSTVHSVALIKPYTETSRPTSV